MHQFSLLKINLYIIEIGKNIQQNYKKFSMSIMKNKIYKIL